MSLRKTAFVAGEYYHLINRGNRKEQIFDDARDYSRFLFLILYLQSHESIQPITRHVNLFRSTILYEKNSKLLNKLARATVKARFVELTHFVLMPNHFHLVVRATQDEGVVQYMQKVLTAYAKYVNTRKDVVGHVFQGPFRSVHVASNEQLLYLSTYIHRNPRELEEWAGKEHSYEWSSYQDYINKNRFGKLLVTDEVLAQFVTRSAYQKHVEESTAKDPEFQTK